MADGGTPTVTARGGGATAGKADGGRGAGNGDTAGGQKSEPSRTYSGTTTPAAMARVASRNHPGAPASSESSGNQSSTTSTADSLTVPAQSARPSLPTKQPSNSLPSTPSVHARKLSDEYRTPPPPIRVPDSVTPRSARSESDSTVRATARAPSLTGCKFETGMAFSRRRIPYSLGGDPLESAKDVKKALDPAGEKTLSGDMRELYDRILPTADGERRRTQLVMKLEKILNQRWPGNDIKVRVFGSSGNLLASHDSDVDICITTPMKALERVCILAKALADHGMERVVCVPNAKVPIVKIWDPELKLACDMNVNNTLALENTRMIRTYVQLDPRVRPLAMVIKHWTQKRILNDAALGGTLSSYTWICLIINFLQTRSPKILPNLQQRPHQCTIDADGRRSPFADDIAALTGFGAANKETLGELLFAFFRRYGHEIDYEHNVISIREGGLISNKDKKWYLMQNNRLCVEEPFNTERNLGNTADDISFRGLHLELRRAFDLIAQAKLDECCGEYVFPPQEEKVWVKPPPQPRPVLTRSLSQQGRGTRANATPGGNGQRSNNYKGRTGASNRRASSATAMNKLPSFPGVQVDRLSGSQIHAQLFHHYQLLQAQEQHLRLQMHERQQQAQLNALGGGQIQQMQGPASAYPLQSGFESLRSQQPIDPGPLSAPLRGPQGSYYPIHLSQQMKSPHLPPTFASSQSSTNPPSPTISVTQPANATGEYGRSSQRSVRNFHANDDNAIVRSQSQPPSNSNMRQGSRPPRSVPVLLPNPNPQGQTLGAATLQQFQQLYLQAKLSAESAQRPKVHSPPGESPGLPPMMMEYHHDGNRYLGYYVDPNMPPGLRGGGFEVPPSFFHPGDERHARARRSSGSPNLNRQTPRSPSPSSTILSPDHMFPHPPAPLHSSVESVRPSSSGALLPQSGKSPTNGAPPRSGPVIVDGSGDFADYATSPEPRPFFMPPGDLRPSPNSQLARPPPPPEEASPSVRGRPVGSSIGGLPGVLQFGDFPARATLRNSRSAQSTAEKIADKQPVVPPLQAAFGEQAFSAGLGIDLSAVVPASVQPKPTATSTPPKPQSTVTTDVQDKSTASFLSPVREVRTPSPTVTRAGLNVGQANGSKPKPPNRGPGIATGSPARKGSSLAEEMKVESIDPSKPSSKVDTLTPKRAEPADAPSAKPAESAHASPSKSNGVASGLASKSASPARPGPPAAQLPPHLQVWAQAEYMPSSQAPTTASPTRPTPPIAQAPIPALSANGGWQQSVSKKTKRNNRKSASVGSVPVDGERKGG